MNIAIVPAKKFSRRLENKNIKKLDKKPIISIVIKKLIKCKIFDKVYVSTDSSKISKISKKYGANINGFRPKYLCKNSASLIDVMNYEIKILKKKYKNLNLVCCVLPTAVFIKNKDLEKAHKILKKNDRKFVFSVQKVEKKLLKSFYLTKTNQCQFLIKKNTSIDSKKLVNTYIDAGQFYFSSHKVWTGGKDIDKFNNSLIEMNNSIDIDDKKDWNKLIKKYAKNFNR